VNIAGLHGKLEPGVVGTDMHALMRELYPICRSITGEGFRDTLARVGRHIPLEIREVPTGTRVFDWTVPQEWNIRDAYIKDPAGERVVDFGRCNLHVVGYSTPVRRTMTLSELKEHVFTLQDHPDWIPYRTSYYERTWGFCLSHRQLSSLREGDYEACIDATLENGFLTYAECYLAGETEEEVLISTHACHPSLANDNLSGVVVATFLAKHMVPALRRYSYRFLFVPGTIGSITWLALNEEATPRIRHGLVLASLGDPGRSTYKKSRRGMAEIDRAAMHVLRHLGDHEILEFEPYGYDERQYGSPGFDLPVGCLMRSPHGRYPQYHTSADDMNFVEPQYLEDSFMKGLSILQVLDGNRTYLNLNPKCEPQLGRRGLYPAAGGAADEDAARMALLWVLNLSDGDHSLLDIAERASLPFSLVSTAAERLLEHDLLLQVPANT
jgi:aminopeptidase-like protein